MDHSQSDHALRCGPIIGHEECQAQQYHQAQERDFLVKRRHINMKVEQLFHLFS